MIKVLLVVCYNVLNGTERYVVDLAKNLPKDIFSVYVATPIKGPLSAILEENNIKELIYDNGKVEYYSFQGLRTLYSLMKEYKIDIVHANAKFQPCLIGKLAGVKLNIETKHGIFYSLQQLNNLSFLRKFYEYAKQFFVDRFIAISENDRKTLTNYFRINEEKINVIYLGIDYNLINSMRYDTTKEDSKRDSNTFMIGHIGRMTFQKAQEYLLQAFLVISRKFPNVKLTMVGTGENERTIKDFVAKNGLEEKVIFEGYIIDIYKKINEFDVHVLTSRFEGTPYVNFEAMALGVPIITSDVGGATNTFQDGYDALITKVEDVQSTAEAIEKLITDIEFRKNIIKNALISIKRYSIENMTKNTAELYLKYIHKL